jgi:peptide/nickel transport system permease protein
LIADIIEISYNHFSHYANSSDPEQQEDTPHLRVQKGWVIFCLVLVFITILFASLAPHFAPYGYNEIVLSERLSPPSSDHIFGADNLGRDIFSRTLYGIRMDLLTPTFALIPGMAINWGFEGIVPWAIFVGILIMVIFPFGWGLLSAYVKQMNNWLGDTLEDILMLPRDIICAFPWFVLGILLMSIFGPGLLPVSLVIGILLVPRILAMMRETYQSPPRGKSWLYGVLWSIPITILFFIAGGILYNSSFSYVGFGIPPPIPELGMILSGTGRQYMLEAPWMARIPSIVLIILIFIWVMAGDAVLEKLGFRSKAVWSQTIE